MFFLKIFISEIDEGTIRNTGTRKKALKYPIHNVRRKLASVKNNITSGSVAELILLPVCSVEILYEGRENKWKAASVWEFGLR